MECKFDLMQMSSLWLLVKSNWIKSKLMTQQTSMWKATLNDPPITSTYLIWKQVCPLHTLYNFLPVSKCYGLRKKSLPLNKCGPLEKNMSSGQWWSTKAWITTKKRTLLFLPLEFLEAAEVDVLVAVQPVISDGRLAPVLAQVWEHPVVLWATPEEQTGEMISGNSLVSQSIRKHLWVIEFLPDLELDT